jgi:hypothetical protein
MCIWQLCVLLLLLLYSTAGDLADQTSARFSTGAKKLGVYVFFTTPSPRSRQIPLASVHAAICCSCPHRQYCRCPTHLCNRTRFRRLARSISHLNSNSGIQFSCAVAASNYPGAPRLEFLVGHLNISTASPLWFGPRSVRQVGLECAIVGTNSFLYKVPWTKSLGALSTQGSTHRD